MKIKIGTFYLEIRISFIIFMMIYIISKIFRRIFYYYFACYMFIMFHEFSHIMVASFFKYECRKIEFSICGMSANINIKNNKLKNIIIFLAGPISNFILSLIFMQNSFIFKINLILCVINLIPVFPLDGYRIAKELKINLKNIERFIYILIIIISILVKNISLIIFLVYIIYLRSNMRKI